MISVMNNKKNNLNIYDTMAAIIDHLGAAVRIIDDDCNNHEFIRFNIADFPEWKFAVDGHFEDGIKYIIGEHIDLINKFTPLETAISCKTVDEFLHVVEDMKKRPNTYFYMSFYNTDEDPYNEEMAKNFKKQYDSNKKVYENVVKAYEDEIDKILHYAMKLGKGKMFKGFGFYGKTFSSKTIKAIMHPKFIKNEHQVFLASVLLREKLYDCYTKYRKILKDDNNLFFHNEYINNYMFVGGSNAVTCIDKLYRYSVPYRISTQEKEIYN